MIFDFSKTDIFHTVSLKRLVQNIDRHFKEGNIFGIPKDLFYISKEKNALEDTSEQKIIEGREHYLRFEVPTTWQIWEDNNLQLDSTCGYAEQEGFRCGTADEFSVFNILTREKLKLKERPLIFMDDNHHSYNDISFDESYTRVAKLIEYAKVYNMKITLLFHNSIFTDDKNINFKKLNEKLLKLV